MASSLARELQLLSKPAPASIDPEDFDINSSNRKYGSGGSGRDYVNSVDAKGIKARYKGTKANKEDIEFFKGDLIVDKDIELEDEIEDVSTESKELINEETSKLYRKELEVEEEEGDETKDKEEEVEKNDIQIVNNQRVKSSNQAKHARRQMQLYSQTVGIRIRLQPLLLKFARFPNKTDLPFFYSVNENMDTCISSIRSDVRSCLKKLVSLQQSLLELNQDFYSTKTSRKRTLSQLEGYDKKLGKRRSRKAALNQLWNSIEQENDALEMFYSECFDQWHERTNLALGISSKKGSRKAGLRAVNQKISMQVDQTLSSSENVILRNQIMPTNCVAFGINSVSKGEAARSDSLSNGPIHNNEIFNDSAFYQQLLKDFVTMSGVDLARKHGGEDVIKANKKLKRRKKANVDVRATKGRRLKYIVHEKLVSFAPSAPDVDSKVPDDRIDILFNSLFAN